MNHVSINIDYAERVSKKDYAERTPKKALALTKIVMSLVRQILLTIRSRF